MHLKLADFYFNLPVEVYLDSVMILTWNRSDEDEIYWDENDATATQLAVSIGIYR